MSEPAKLRYKKCRGDCNRELEDTVDNFATVSSGKKSYRRNICKQCRKNQVKLLRKSNRAHYSKNQRHRRQHRKEVFDRLVSIIQLIYPNLTYDLQERVRSSLGVIQDSCRDQRPSTKLSLMLVGGGPREEHKGPDQVADPAPVGPVGEGSGDNPPSV